MKGIVICQITYQIFKSIFYSKKQIKNLKIILKKKTELKNFNLPQIKKIRRTPKLENLKPTTMCHEKLYNPPTHIPCVIHGKKKSQIF